MVKLVDDQFKLDAMADSILAFKGAPKYDLLTPELSQKVAGLAGKQLHKDDLEVETLGMEMEALGMHDGRGTDAAGCGECSLFGVVGCYASSPYPRSAR